MSRIPIERKIIWGYWLAIIVLFSIAIFTYHNSRQLENSNFAVAHTYKVLNSLDEINSLCIEMQSATRGFIISPRPAFKQVIASHDPKLMNGILESRLLLKDNPEQVAKVSLLSEKLNQFSNIQMTLISIREIQGEEQAKNYFLSSESPRVMLEIKQLINQMSTFENNNLRSRELMRDELIQSFNWLYISLLSSVFIMMIILYNNIIRSIKKSRIGQ